MQHRHIVQVDASVNASLFPLVLYDGYDEPFYCVFQTLFTKHPQYQWLVFTGQHYTTVAEYLMIILHPLYVFSFKYCYSCADQRHFSSLCRSAEELYVAEDETKRNHTKNVLVLLYITHVLRHACKSAKIMRHIFHTEDRNRRWYNQKNFHANFTLDGWNDRIIQPARDAVLDYYKVHTRPISLHTVLTLKLNQPDFICFSALRRAIQSQRVLAHQQSILVSTCVWLYPFASLSIVSASLPHSYNHIS